MTTERQKQAVKFCEEYVCIRFTGDINNYRQVSKFLHEYLDYAKEISQEIKECWGDDF